jgi:tetratricopeptide (TPR) repeat protein
MHLKTVRKQLFLWFSICFLNLAIFSNPLWAKERLKVDVQLHKDWTRIMLFCPQSRLSAHIGNNILHIHLDKQFAVDLGGILPKASKDIRKTSSSPDGRTLQFTLQSGNYKLRKFASDNYIGLDLIKINKTKSDSLPNPHTFPKKHEKVVIEKVNKKNEAKTIASIEPKPKAIPSKTTPKPAPQPKQEPPKRSQKIEIPIINLPASQDNLASKETLTPLVIEENDNTQKFIFPWSKKVAAAVFMRAGYLWVIFNEAAAIGLQGINAQNSNLITDCQQIGNKKYSILHCKSNNLISIKTQKEKLSWVITLSKNQNTVLEPNTIISQYKSPYSRGIFFPAENMSDRPLAIQDPLIGDELLIVPFYQGDTGVKTGRQFIDFNLLPSAEGFVITPISDNTMVNVILPGIEVVVPLQNLSSKVLGYNYNVGPERDDIHLYSLFPFDQYQEQAQTDYHFTASQLEYNIIEAQPENKHRARLELAKFLLGIGLAKETLGVTQYMAKYRSSLLDLTPVKLIKGAAEFMTKNYSAAKATFESINQAPMSDEEKNELQFWIKASNIALGSTVDNFSTLANKEKFLMTYLEPLKYEFSLLDIQNSLNKNDLPAADKVLDEVNIDTKKRPNLIQTANSFNYYRGLYQLQSQDLKGALKTWEGLTENVLDRYNRTRSTLAIVKALVDAKKISTKEAIDRLNKIRNSWRSEDVEVGLLRYLGNLYNQDHNYLEALRTWKKLTEAYPKNPELFFILADMSKVFMNVFGKDGVAQQLSNFDSVAFFYEFHDLTPIGAAGDEIITNLAYKLVKLDLLDKAAALLLHQVNNRLSGVARSEAINKLAVVYLLNRQPTKAIETLNKIDPKNSSKDIYTAALHIKAKALIDLNKVDDALALLAKDNTEEGNDIKIQIYWNKKKWDAIQSILEPYVSVIKPTNQKLSKQDSEKVAQLALVYALQTNDTKLHELYNLFKGKLEEGSANVFEFIASNNEPISPQNLEASIGINNAESFLQKYKSAILTPKT